MWHSDDTEVQVWEQGETGGKEITWPKTQIHIKINDHETIE